MGFIVNFIIICNDIEFAMLDEKDNDLVSEGRIRYVRLVSCLDYYTVRHALKLC